MCIRDSPYTVADWARGGQVFSTTSTTLTLPGDQGTWTPTGGGIPQATADTRYISFLDPSVIGNPRLSASERAQARQNLGLGDSATTNPADFNIDTTGESYISATGPRTINADQIDLTSHVTGELPLTNINSTQLNQRIDMRAAEVGSVHRFDDTTAFAANTLTWHTGDILIIGTSDPVTYLYTGTDDATSQSLTDFTRITIPGGGINQATADGRYLQISNNLNEITDDAAARTSLGLGNSAVLSVGTAPNTVAAGDHNHDTRYPRICLLYTSPSPRDATLSRMPSSA